jgi:hypothetical protein
MINYQHKLNNMKKLYSTIMMFAMMVAALSFTACGGDDDDNEGSDVAIVGVWEVTSCTAQSDFDVEGGIAVGDRIYFNADGTYRDSEDTGRWSKSGNTITITLNDGSIPGVFQIKKLTTTELEMLLDYGFLTATVKCKRVS